MLTRYLIINADDLNLTASVSEAILDACRNGVVTSSTIFMTRPVSLSLIKHIQSCKQLGLGVHLNVTLGEPVSRTQKIRSLISPLGIFRKTAEQRKQPPKAAELFCEWQSQIEKFQKVFGKRPTHLDTHHHLHAEPFFFRVLCELSRKWRLPIRRSRLMKPGKTGLYFSTPNYFWGDLNPKDYWRKSKLQSCLQKMPWGVNEIMCHPGKNSAELSRLSSFSQAREVEWKLFKSRETKALIQRLGIVLTHYGLLY